MSNIDELIEWLRGCAGTPHAVQMCNDAADALEKLQVELEQAKAERDAAVDCIYQIEDDLDRGSDNDWAREHISEWESQNGGA